MPGCRYGGSGRVGVTDATSAGLAAHLQVQGFRFRFRVATWQVDEAAIPSIPSHPAQVDEAVARARYFMVPEHEDMHERFREILRV